MDDRKIIDLFFSRSERAVSECEEKYGRYLYATAKNILGSDEDAKEAVNDAYLTAWNNIPPARPERLCAYLGMICRSRAIDKARANSRVKRCGYEESFDEMDDVVSGDDSSPCDRVALRDALNAFLSGLDMKARVIFLRRYFWCSSIPDISNDLNLSDGAVKMSLSRTRKKLKEHLIKEGFDL